MRSQLLLSQSILLTFYYTLIEDNPSNFIIWLMWSTILDSKVIKLSDVCVIHWLQSFMMSSGLCVLEY